MSSYRDVIIFTSNPSQPEALLISRDLNACLKVCLQNEQNGEKSSSAAGRTRRRLGNTTHHMDKCLCCQADV